MTRPLRWIAGLAAAAALLLGGGALLLKLWLPTDGELAAEVGARFQKASGIGLKVGAAHWSPHWRMAVSTGHRSRRTYR